MQQASKYLLRLYKSNKYTYAQVISPVTRQIVLSASSIEPSLRNSLPSTSNKEVRQLARFKLPFSHQRSHRSY